MKEQLTIKGETKKALLEDLLQLKDSFMSWGQTQIPGQKNWFEEGKTPSKVTDEYTFKYVFSELTTNVGTATNSRALSRRQFNSPQDQDLKQE